MASDDPFKKVQEAGADFLETARARAEEFLRELARLSDTTGSKGQGALDDLLGASRKSTEALVTSIRNEIANQVQMLGLATKRDLSNLEARLRGSSGTAKKTTAARSTAKKTTTAAKSTAKKATPAKRAAKSTAKKATPAKRAATAKKATPAKKTSTAKKTPAKRTTAAKKTAG